MEKIILFLLLAICHQLYAFREDGDWGNWGQYSACSGSCGWGQSKRARKCDNPAPSNGGKSCDGRSVERKLCRNTRCGGPGPNDQSFDSFSFGRWKTDRFTLKKSSGWSFGPKKDHTSELKGIPGYYASVVGVGEHNPKENTGLLWSSFINSFKGEKCISFSYMWNGNYKFLTSPLSLYVKEGKRYLNLPFSKIYLGNGWNRATFDFKDRKEPFQIVIQVLFKPGGTFKSEVAIDDITFDHNACQKGLNECKDLIKNCATRAQRGDCNKPELLRFMLGNCCATCNDPILGAITPCVNYRKGCDGWAKDGECFSPVYRRSMRTYCCKACRDIKRR